MLRPPRRTERGLTLIEVLVALAVIAIGLVAVVAVAARSGQVTSGLQQRTFADWVAANEIARLRLQSKWPAVGESDGKVKLAGRDWHWQTTVEGTPDPDLRRITVEVALADSPQDSITQLLGFVARPSQKPVGAPGAGSSPHPHPSKKPGS